MSTPYEEISENYSSVEAVKTDATLAQDSLQLGGIDADEYATKDYVKKYVSNVSSEDREYTDEQIANLTEQLKGYTDTVVGNIDLTPYAKKTDVEAEVTNLKEHCSTSCSNTLETAKEYTDTTNSNILASAMDYTDAQVSSLFQSVSNGKSLIAEAITDKGVATSASDSYSTMASNIRSIDTSGLDTSDATATASTILQNYTAYARGAKITGTYVPTSGGTDTSDATAVASDIKYGKTAYVNGIKLTGTLHSSTKTTTSSDGTTTTTVSDVDEIYRLSGEGYQAQTVLSYYYADNEDSDGLDTATISAADIICYKGRTYIVRALKESSGDKYIYSNKIYNGSIVKQSSVGDTTYKKYKYTYDELGIEGEIQKILFGSPGYMGNEYLCLLVIIEEIIITDDEGTTSSNFVAHFYPYHLSDEGIIGNSYSGEFNYPNICLTIDRFSSSYPDRFAAAKLSANTFAYAYEDSYSNNYIKLLHVYDDTGYISETSTTLISNSTTKEYSFSRINFEVSDTILNCVGRSSSGSVSRVSAIIFIEKNEYGHYQIAHYNSVGSTMNYYFSDDGQYMYYILTNASASSQDYGLYSVDIDYTNYSITLSVIKESLVYSWIKENGGNSSSTISRVKFSKDNQYLFVLSKTSSYSTWEILKLDINGDDTSIVSGAMYGGSNNSMSVLWTDLYDDSYCYCLGDINLIEATTSTTSQLLAIKYSNEIFYSVKAISSVKEDSE